MTGAGMPLFLNARLSFWGPLDGHDRKICREYAFMVPLGHLWYSFLPRLVQRRVVDANDHLHIASIRIEYLGKRNFRSGT